MRVLAFLLVVLLSVIDLHAAEPRFRPALVGNGPNALVNLIDTKRLVEKGQRDGLVMFKCFVGRSGKGWGYHIYRETPGSKLLKDEVGRSLLACRFIPAIYNGERTEVALLGTVAFVVADGKPHLRIYMNQNHGDVAKGNNFIAPQLVMSSTDYPGSQYDVAGYREGVYRQTGWIQLSVTVDAKGNQKDLKVISEDPPGLSFSTAPRDIYAKAKWIPGFRNGRPVEVTFDYPDWFLTWR